MEPIQVKQERYDHCRIAVIGNVDSGKSTLTGVLTKGIADDGRGSARLRVFNFAHEVENGRTSSIAQEIIGFDANNKQVLPDRFNQNKNKYWKEIVDKSDKVVTLLDLCGHEKYLKTTIFGMIGLVPDYAMIVIGANMGISKMTKEHLGITIALKVPFFVVLTKVDMCPENIFQETYDVLCKLLKSHVVNRVPVEIKDGHSDEELKKCAESLPSDKICPIFNVSSVTGQGIPELLKFQSLIKNRDTINRVLRSKDDPIEFDINENFVVPGVGLVISGLIKAGTAKLNQVCVLGPDKNKTFKTVMIKSIHVNRALVEKAYCGEFACFSIKPAKANDKLSRDEFRKGMVLLDPVIQPNPIYEFDAEVIILHHSTTIKEGYQSVLHCGVIRQAVQVVKIYDKELLRNGDKALVRFKFMYNPEYLKKGLVILLREGRTKILGEICTIITEQQNQQNQQPQQKAVAQKLENEQAPVKQDQPEEEAKKN